MFRMVADDNCAPAVLNDARNDAPVLGFGKFVERRADQCNAQAVGMLSHSPSIMGVPGRSRGQEPDLLSARDKLAEKLKAFTVKLRASIDRHARDVSFWS